MSHQVSARDAALSALINCYIKRAQRFIQCECQLIAEREAKGLDASNARASLENMTECLNSLLTRKRAIAERDLDL